MAATNYYTTAEVAALLNVKPETVRRWVRDGTIRAIKIGRVHRISWDDLLRAGGRDHGGREFTLQIEHELHLHSPLGGICQSCGDSFPCVPILEVARVLEVEVMA